MLKVSFVDSYELGSWGVGELLRRRVTWLDIYLRKIILAASEGWIGRGLDWRQEDQLSKWEIIRT